MSEADKEFVADMEWLHSHDREAALPPEKLARIFALARRGADAFEASNLRGMVRHHQDQNTALRAEVEWLRAALTHADAKGQENDKLLWGTIKDNERLKAEVSALNHAEVKLLVRVDEQDAEIERLREALRYALENGTTAVYGGDDDECGTYSCCGEVSYKPHEDDCWTVKARAALKEDGE